MFWEAYLAVIAGGLTLAAGYFLLGVVVGFIKG